jgi:hypothetical protein
MKKNFILEAQEKKITHERQNLEFVSVTLK